MNKLLAVVVSVFAVSVGWGQSASAQQPMDKAAPVEFFACNWQQGKGMADLKKVAEKFSKWADKNDMQYAAWILTPQFTAADLGFQVGWLGGWPSYSDFGKGQDSWMASGGDLGDDFNEVIDCISHESASSAVVNAPDEPPGDGVVMFSQCTLQPGVKHADALAGHRKVGAMMKEMGSPASSWLFFPGMGSGDIDFHYWSVIGVQNYTDLGKSSELYINGGGWQKAMAILAPLTRCKSPAVFDVHSVRQGGGS